MNAIIALGIAGAVALIALALQGLARVIHGLPLDQRRADPLIDVSSRAAGSMRPAELHQLTTLVANSVLSDASYRSELQPLLDRLGSGRGGATPVAEAAPAARGRLPGGRSRRSDRLAEAIAEVETAWGLGADQTGEGGGVDGPA